MARQNRSLRIGIYGGKFDPIHYGHLVCAEWVRQEYNLDRVLFVTSATPPNKTTGVVDAEDRHEMVVASVAENPFFDPSRVDLEHGGTGYSLLTVEGVREKFGEDAELFYLSSSEYLDPNHKWWLKKWVGGKELFKLCTFLIFPRERTEIAKVKKWRKLIPEAKIEILDVPSPELSSTMIRDLVAQGRSIRYMTPWVVQQMLEKKGLYGSSAVARDAHQGCGCGVTTRPVKSVAIYGGQFDPIHYGHLICAEQARQQYGLDRVLFVTSANPPNNNKAQLSAEDRHEMVVAAVSDNPYFEASRIDLDRNTKSYAILTVEQVKARFGEDVEVSWLLSSKYLNPKDKWHLRKWMGSDGLFRMVRFLVIPSDAADAARAREWAKLLAEARIEVMAPPVLPVTSELIRELVANGHSIWYTTPWPVQQVIAKRGLYKVKGKLASHPVNRTQKATGKRGANRKSPKPARRNRKS